MTWVTFLKSPATQKFFAFSLDSNSLFLHTLNLKLSLLLDLSRLKVSLEFRPYQAPDRLLCTKILISNFFNSFIIIRTILAMPGKVNISTLEKVNCQSYKTLGRVFACAPNMKNKYKKKKSLLLDKTNINVILNGRQEYCM